MWELWVPGSLSLAIIALLAWLPNRNSKAVEASTDALDGVVSALHEARSARDEARVEANRVGVLLGTRDTKIAELEEENRQQRAGMDAMAAQIATLMKRVENLDGTG